VFVCGGVGVGTPAGGGGGRGGGGGGGGGVRGAIAPPIFNNDS